MSDPFGSQIVQIERVSKCAFSLSEIIHSNMTTFFVLLAECKNERWFVIRNIIHFVRNFKF